MLNINLPRNTDEKEGICKAFNKKSSNELMSGCVGAIDGFFQPRVRPSKNDTKNTKVFYSGHFERHGLNCQAIYDIRLHFLYFGVIALQMC